MRDKDIDDFLKELDSKEYQITGYQSLVYFDKEKIEKTIEKYNESVNFDYLINEIKVLKILSKGEISFFGLTKKGRKVIRQGGWIKYLERQDEIEKTKERKENAEIHLTEFKVKTGMLPYYVAFASFILSIISVINSCSNEKENKKQPIEKQSCKTEKTILQNPKVIDTNFSKINKQKIND